MQEVWRRAERGFKLAGVAHTPLGPGRETPGASSGCPHSGRGIKGPEKSCHGTYSPDWWPGGTLGGTVDTGHGPAGVSLVMVGVPSRLCGGVQPTVGDGERPSCLGKPPVRCAWPYWPSGNAFCYPDITPSGLTTVRGQGCKSQPALPRYDAASRGPGYCPREVRVDAQTRMVRLWAPTAAQPWGWERLTSSSSFVLTGPSRGTVSGGGGEMGRFSGVALGHPHCCLRMSCGYGVHPHLSGSSVQAHPGHTAIMPGGRGKKQRFGDRG